MKSHEQFLKDVEADIARLNEALGDDEDMDMDEDDLLEPKQASDVEMSDPKVGVVTKEDPTDQADVFEEVFSETVPAPASQDLVIGEETELDTMAMLREHEALLRRIDTALAKSDDGAASPGHGTEYDQYHSQYENAALSTNGIGDEEKNGDKEEEEEAYFKDMNNFVESDVMDVEKLYDVLEMNLQYQDFLAKLGAEVERKLAINKEKQKEAADDDDHMYLVSRGYLDNKTRTRPFCCKTISLQRFRSPYFNNHYKNGPLMNADQIRLSKNPRSLVFSFDFGWGKCDRNNLFNCLKTAIIGEKMTEFMATKTKEEADLFHEKLQGTTLARLLPDEDILSWTEHQWEEVVMSMKSLSCGRSRPDIINQWTNFLSPSINKTNWSSSEDKLLEQLVSEHGKNSWQVVSSHMKSGRIAWQCLQRFQKLQKKVSSQWTVADDKHLMDAVMIYGDASFADLSYYLGDKNSDQCLQRWRYSICPQIKRGKWTQEEDGEIMAIISEHGYDWQKIKDVQKQRTRSQVRERVRILMAKEISGSNGATNLWSVAETFQLMQLVAKHGNKNWAMIKKGMEDRYTAPLLFRRWVRIVSLLNGNIKRVTLAWERTFLNELLKPKRYINRKLMHELKDLLPDDEAKARITDLLAKVHVIHGKSSLYKTQLKRRIQEIGEHEEEEEAPSQLASSSHDIAPNEANLYSMLRLNAGNIYKKAFEVGNGSQFKMYYTPPSVTTVSAFRSLLIDEIPKLREQAAVGATEQVTLPDEILQSHDYNLLAARFKSLFSWPLVMGETPV